ncbi:amine sulfotransferase-like isoform X1 [Lethenteron reissneri]|uniref:amine sulfotransferase-like isoform X1 n=2 Tax=Lethenteron reissneri TaxID=7753 RepID=UPI002AB69C10|nr:amine sulfotransferase-like isoform X1 [Lethenteron reissneri]
MITHRPTWPLSTLPLAQDFSCHGALFVLLLLLPWTSVLTQTMEEENSNVDCPPFSEYKGISFPTSVQTPESLQYSEDFDVRDDDVFVVTYPKSGTTWMQEITTLIVSGGDLTPVKTIPSWERVPWVENITGKGYLENRPSPRLISTHAPYSIAPKKLREGKGKAIYVTRNPKDVMVSVHHFSKFAQFLANTGTLEECFHNFVSNKAQLQGGSWFTHVRGWHEHKDAPNIFMISFEDMVMDLRGSVKRIADFMERPLSESALDTIAEHCTFSSMKKSPMANYSLVPNKWLDHNVGTFMRKGTVGNWKSEFTVELSEKFDTVYAKKMEGCDLKFVWDIAELHK